MTIKDIEGARLLFDPQSPTLVDDVKVKIPEFEAYEGIVGIQKVIQYIILMYDYGTPMRIEKPDYFQRKYAVAMMVGFPRNKKEFTPESEEIILGANSLVNHLIVAYLAQFGLPAYTALLAHTALLSFETHKIFNGKQTKDSPGLIDKAEARVRELTREVFKSGDYDEYTMLRQTLYARIEKERLRLRPEQIVRYLEDNGCLPEDFSPYDASYKINLKDDMVFIGDK